MSIGTIILIILVIALLGGFSGLGGGPFYGTGYYGGGGIGLVLVSVLILVLPWREWTARPRAAQPPFPPRAPSGRCGGLCLLAGQPSRLPGGDRRRGAAVDRGQYFSGR